MLPDSEFSEPVQTRTVGYPVLSGTRANTIYYITFDLRNQVYGAEVSTAHSKPGMTS